MLCCIEYLIIDCEWFSFDRVLCKHVVTQTQIFLGIFLHHAWEYRRIIGFSYTIEIYDISC